MSIQLGLVLEALAERLGAHSVILQDAEGGLPYSSWGLHRDVAMPEMTVGLPSLSQLAPVLDRVLRSHSGTILHEDVDELSFSGIAVVSDHFVGVLCVFHPKGHRLTAEHESAMRLASHICTSVQQIKGQRNTQERLDELVTYCASVLMSIGWSEVSRGVDEVVRVVGKFFAVDSCFLRYNDFDLGLTRLVAISPPRDFVPSPDPLYEIPFDSDDAFSLVHDFKDVLLVPSDPQAFDGRYAKLQALGYAATRFETCSLVAVPMLSGTDTTGMLTLATISDRNWTAHELGALRAISGLLSQMYARVTAEEELHRLAHVDELTGLPNRRAVFEVLADWAAQADKRPFALMFVDMDRLKVMNDLLGHTGGDIFLRSVATELRQYLDKDDVIARISGDEFVILRSNCRNVVQARTLAANLLSQVAVPLEIMGRSVSRSACFGIAMSYGAETNPTDLLRSADLALREAKSEGSGTIKVFDDELQRTTLDRAALELYLASAAGNGELRLFFQPEIDLASDRVIALEALVRWDHPRLGMLGAGDFIPIAEESNLVGQIGNWVLDTAMQQLARWKQLPGLGDLMIRINVSVSELVGLDLVDRLQVNLERHHLDGSDVCLEVTESSVIKRLDVVQNTLNAVRKLGVRLAIDDFGTGYSSLAQLRDLPFDVLKIDQQFVRNLRDDPKNQAIVAATIALAQAMHLETVAEGIEDAESMRILSDLGCGSGQGYYLARPKPASDAEAWLRRMAERKTRDGMGAVAFAEAEAVFEANHEGFHEESADAPFTEVIAEIVSLSCPDGRPLPEGGFSVDEDAVWPFDPESAVSPVAAEVREPQSQASPKAAASAPSARKRTKPKTSAAKPAARKPAAAKPAAAKPAAPKVVESTPHADEAEVPATAEPPRVWPRAPRAS
ncbi:EAL domain-containing protein [Micrococcales bacterium 31B]|nr:EAL domain-containing protein [Micrococcales bacterium 31B]